MTKVSLLFQVYRDPRHYVILSARMVRRISPFSPHGTSNEEILRRFRASE